MKALEESLGEPPSANLIRALVASGVTTPAGGSEWLVGEESALKLIGFGQCQADEPLRSTNNRVRLVAMDEVEENKLHIYRIPIPADFIRERGKRGITISLAYDPPVRASRKEYIARTMWFHAVHGLTTDEVVRVCGKMSDTDEPVERTGSFLKMRPTRTKSQWSTLQVRKIDWPYRTYPRIQILEGESEPVLHVVVGCHKRFSTGLEAMQKYGIVILFWHEGEQLELYQSFRSLVNVRTSRIRV